MSIDGGATWMLADLLGKAEPWRWNIWEARVELEAGKYEIVVRARDSAGNSQRENARGQWNFKGYAWNAWHRVNVQVSG